MLYILSLIAFLVIGLVVFKELNRPNPKEYYPPLVYTVPEYYSVSVPVEIAEKDGKKAFVKLFEKYGFSGNGPSIEQVIRKNIKLENIEYDSEGDAFVAYTTDQTQFLELAKAVRCIENIECLDNWLNNSKWILIKE